MLKGDDRLLRTFTILILQGMLIFADDESIMYDRDIAADYMDPGPLINRARAKRSWMSSVKAGSASFMPSFGNDGDRSNDDGIDCVHTNKRDKSMYRWWRVDLLNYYAIFLINLTNRADCCHRRLKNIEIRIAMEIRNATATDENAKQGPDIEKVCGNTSGVIPPETITIACEPPIIGRYVTVLHPSAPDEYGPPSDFPAILSFCEIQIFGDPLTDQDELYVDSIASAEEAAFESKFVILGPGKVMPSDMCYPKPDNYYCHPNTTCIDGVCKIRLGQRCSGYSKDDCYPGTQCDRHLCRLSAGQDCSRRSKWCITLATCSRENGKQLCKMMPGGMCVDTADCSSGMICDSLHYCKNPQGSTCAETNECVAGAVCAEETCVCNATVAMDNGKLCAPQGGVVSGTCAELCRDNNANCTGKGGLTRCQCNSGYTVEFMDYGCKLKVGSECQKNKDCVSWTICEPSDTGRLICKIKMGQRCETAENDLCVKEAICDGGICRLRAGQPCDNELARYCRTGTLCDTSVNGTVTCRIAVGMACHEGQTECQNISSCDKGVCKLKPGQKCEAQNIWNCHSDAECDLDFICRIQLNKSCSQDLDCKKGLLCDNNVCKKGLDRFCNEGRGGCKSGLTCDRVNRCHTAISGDCSTYPELCLSGAQCVKSKCQCDDRVSDSKDPQCEPKKQLGGGSCSSSEPCMTPFSSCNVDTSTCVCDEGYALDHRNYSCKLAVGESCDLNTDCVSDSVCDINGRCMIKPGRNCEGRKRRMFCMSQTTCEDGLCRYNVHSNCKGHEDFCRKELVCDYLKMCKTPLDSWCMSNIDIGLETCVAGARCVHGKCHCHDTVTVRSLTKPICEPKANRAGGQCSQVADKLACPDPNAYCSNTTDTCHCLPEFTKDRDFTCKKNAGQICKSDDEDDCVTGTSCGMDGICKIELGHACNADQQGLCRDYGVCDTDFQCHIDYNHDCKGHKSECRQGSQCDNTNSCRISVGDDCSAEPAACVAGSSCAAGRCKCTDSENVIETGVLCLPKKGRVSAACDSGSVCHDPNTYCSESGVCICAGSFMPDYSDYTCRNNAAASSSLSASYHYWIVAAVLVATFAIVLAVIGRRRVMKKKQQGQGGMDKMSGQASRAFPTKLFEELKAAESEEGTETASNPESMPEGEEEPPAEQEEEISSVSSVSESTAASESSTAGSSAAGSSTAESSAGSSISDSSAKA